MSPNFWLYLCRLRCSLQDKCSDALLVAVVVHYYERMRQPRCCEEEEKKNYFSNSSTEPSLQKIEKPRCHYWRHSTDQCSWAGVGPGRWAGPEQWTWSPLSAAGPVPGSAAVPSEGSGLKWGTASEESEHTVSAAATKTFILMRETHLLVFLYLCDQQEFIKQEQIRIDQLCVLWWETKETFLDFSRAKALMFQQLQAPVSTSFPSWSRLLWEMRLSAVTVFRRCFSVWKKPTFEDRISW